MKRNFTILVSLISFLVSGFTMTSSADLNDATLLFEDELGNNIVPGFGTQAFRTGDGGPGSSLFTTVGDCDPDPGEKSEPYVSGVDGRVFYLVTKAGDYDPSNPPPLKDRWGTLRYAIEEAPKPIWILFDQVMFPEEQPITIEIDERLRLQDMTVIDGRGSNVVIEGPCAEHLFAATEGVEHIVIENVFLKKKCDEYQGGEGYKDVIKIMAQANKIWLDHITFRDCGDDCVNADYAEEDVDVDSRMTISFCRFRDVTNVERFGHAVVIGFGTEGCENRRDKDFSLTMMRSYINKYRVRMPKIAQGYAHVYNNYLREWKTDYGAGSDCLGQLLFEYNIARMKQGGSSKATQYNFDTNGFIKTRYNYSDNGAEFNDNLAVLVREPSTVWESYPPYTPLAVGSDPELLTADDISGQSGRRNTGDIFYELCIHDVTRDNVVNIQDIFEVNGEFGACGYPCPCDLTGDGIVNIEDVFEVLGNWGDCEGRPCN